MHQVGEVLQYIHPFVVHGYEFGLFLVELRNLYIYICQFIVEHLVRIHLHQLPLMVPALGILKSIRKVEVQQTDCINGIKM